MNGYGFVFKSIERKGIVGDFSGGGGGSVGAGGGSFDVTAAHAEAQKQLRDEAIKQRTLAEGCASENTQLREELLDEQRLSAERLRDLEALKKERDVAHNEVALLTQKNSVVWGALRAVAASFGIREDIIERNDPNLPTIVQDVYKNKNLEICTLRAELTAAKHRGVAAANEWEAKVRAQQDKAKAEIDRLTAELRTAQNMNAELCKENAQQDKAKAEHFDRLRAALGAINQVGHTWESLLAMVAGDVPPRAAYEITAALGMPDGASQQAILLAIEKLRQQARTRSDEALRASVVTAIAKAALAIHPHDYEVDTETVVTSVVSAILQILP